MLYQSGKSPIESMDRLPVFKIKEIQGEGQTPIKSGFSYDSYFEGFTAQFHTPNMRGTIYAKELTVSVRQEGTHTYNVVLQAQTLEPWLKSPILLRGKQYELTYGWSDDLIVVAVEAFDVKVTFLQDFGGLEIRLDLKEGGFDNVYGISAKNKAIKKGFQENIKNLTLETVFGIFIGEADRAYGILGDMTFDTEKSHPDALSYKFTRAEANSLLAGDKPIIQKINEVLDTDGFRAIFDMKNKKIYVVKELLGEEGSNFPPSKYTYYYGSYNSEILDLDISLAVLVPDASELTEQGMVIEEGGLGAETGQGVSAIHALNERRSVEMESEVYGAGSDWNAYHRSRDNIFIAPVTEMNMTALGNPSIELQDVITIEGISDLSGDFVLTEISHKITPGHFVTEMKGSTTATG